MTFTSSSSFLFVIVIVLAAFALTTGKDAVKIEDLAKQLETARQESSQLRQESAKLRQQLEKSHEETKDIIKRENKKLRSEDEELKKENKKLRRQDEELRKQVEELRQQVEELRKQDEELRQDNSEVKQAFRQRDQNNTLELQNVVRNSFGFRQMDFTAELKKLMNKQIKEYLDDNKMCVMGQIGQDMDESGFVSKNLKIEFGQTFQRKPAFAAALSLVQLKTSGDSAYAQLYDILVTSNSSAKVTINGYNCYRADVTWIACM